MRRWRAVPNYNGVPETIETFMDAYYCGKEMAMHLNHGGWRARRAARRLARRWWDGYQLGFTECEGPAGTGSGAGLVDGHWRRQIDWRA